MQLFIPSPKFTARHARSGRAEPIVTPDQTNRPALFVGKHTVTAAVFAPVTQHHQQQQRNYYSHPPATTSFPFVGRCGAALATHKKRKAKRKKIIFFLEKVIRAVMDFAAAAVCRTLVVNVFINVSCVLYVCEAAAAAATLWCLSTVPSCSLCMHAFVLRGYK